MRPGCNPPESIYTLTRRSFLGAIVAAPTVAEAQKPSSVTVFREEPKRQQVAVPILAGLRSLHWYQGELRRVYRLDWSREGVIVHFEDPGPL